MSGGGKPSGMNFFDWYAGHAAYQAGFRGSALATAVAVAIAESGGDQMAVNRNTDGSTDRGPWQINDKAHPNVTDAQAFDWVYAAQAAFQISSGGKNWSPWVTYKTRAYLPFMGRGVAAANAAGKDSGLLPNLKPGSGPEKSADSGAFGSGVGSPTGFGNPLKGIEAVGQFFSAVYDFFFHHNGSLRILYVLGGAFLLFMALRIFTSELGGGGSSHPLLPPIAKAVA